LREIVISVTLILILRFRPQGILPERLPKLAQE
jgi:ABC-type branched-subunit amino acid transport system permease subunit